MLTNGIARHWGLRRYLLMGGIVLGASMVHVAAADAQVPTIDTVYDVSAGTRLLERVAEWYATAVHWRKALLDKANAMLDQTRELVRTRELYERLAVGELGTLGGAVPDWRRFANACAVGATGATHCAPMQLLSARFEGVLPNTYYQYHSALFGQVSDGDSSLTAVIRGPPTRDSSWASAYRGSTAEYVTQRLDFLDTLGKAGAASSEAGRALNGIIDSTVVASIQGRPVSSGRAQQLTAALDHAEGETEIDLARTRVQALEAATVTAADHVQEHRRATVTQSVASVAY